MLKTIRFAAIALVFMLVPPMSGCLFAQLAGHSGVAGLGGANPNGHVVLQSITVTPPSQSQVVGSQIGFTATGMFSNGTTINLTKYVVWSTSNNDIGQLIGLTSAADPTESVNCKGAGSSQIAASYGVVRGTTILTCSTAPPPASLVSIQISPTTVSQNVGQTTQLQAIGTYSDNSTQDITAAVAQAGGWSVADTTVAQLGTLSKTIPLSCIHGGSTTATATLNGVTQNASVSCVATLTAITVSPSTVSANTGTSVSFLATGSYNDGTSKDVTTALPSGWSSSAPSVGAISTLGTQQQVNCLTAGTATISLTIGTVSGSATLTCNAPPPPQPTVVSVSVSPTTPTVVVGSTFMFTARATLSDGSSQDVTNATGVSWSSSNTATASIGSSANPQPVNCVAVGSSNIQATYQSVSGSTTISCVNPPPTLNSIVVTPASPNTYNGSSVPMTATGTYSDGTKQNVTSSATWSSSNTGAVTLGTASTTITATCAASGSSTLTAAIGAVSGNTIMSCSPQPTGTGGNVYCTPSGTWVGSTTDGPAKMPIACMYTPLSATPSPGTVHTVSCSLSALQSAVNAGACGDSYTLPAGCDLGTGTLTLPAKGCDDAHWNLIESLGASDPNFPPEGSRATPCVFNVQTMLNRTYPCPTAHNLGFRIAAPAANSAIVAPGADHWRIIGALITRVATPGVAIYFPVDLSHSSGTQTSKIIFDRDWFAGIEGTFPATATTTDTSTTRAIYLGQSNHVAVIDSYLTNFYTTSVTSANGNSDSQCVAGGFGSIANSGWGVYKFVNNHCEAGSEGFMLGGSVGPSLTPTGCTPLVNCNLDVPTDIEVRNNDFFKPPQWDGNTSAAPGGKGWPVVKNGFELKSGARALFEGNVVENCWYNSQVCMTFSIAGVNQQNNAGTAPTCPTCELSDLTYRYNYGYKAAYGLGLYSYTTSTCPSCVPLGTFNVSIHDNVLGDALSLAPMCPPNDCSAGDAMEVFATSDPTHTGLAQVNNISISHNTFVRNVRAIASIGSSSTGQMHGITIQDNIFPYGTYGVISNPSLAGCSTQNSFFFILNNCAGTTGWTADHNAVFNWPTNVALGGTWPTNGSGLGNFFYNGVSPVGFTSYGVGDSSFNPANYQLTTSSPLHNAAHDGKDVGADIPTLLQKIAGVRF